MAILALVLLAAAAALQAAFLLARKHGPDPFSHFLLAAAALLLLAVTVDRSIRISFVAITNTYESLLFFSAAISLALFFLRVLLKERLPAFASFGATVIALALLLLSSSPLAPKEIQPPIPALQSLWLVLHVSFSFIGEAFFAVSFASAIVALAARSEAVRRDAERITYTTIGIGYPVFTAGALVFGAIWAQAAWGSYWSWDPKETWALVTWLTYTAYLHTRFIRRLRGRLSSVLAIAGFAGTLFTFFGVNYLLMGLHSYG
jgi:ABC-type transport system involved in cytochrome c biogenesis permease subunit